MKRILWLVAMMVWAGSARAIDNETSPGNAPPSTGKVNPYQIKPSTEPITGMPAVKLKPKRSRKKIVIPAPDVKEPAKP